EGVEWRGGGAGRQAGGNGFHLGVGFLAGEVGERQGIHQLPNRRSPHARVGVLARDLGQQIALLERNLLDEREPNGGVGMFVTRLGAKPIENCHTGSSLTAAVSLSGPSSAWPPQPPPT